MDEFLQDYEIFDLGDVTLQHGATLRDAKLAYKTFGQLNADKSNAIVYPTWYSGRHWDNEWLIGDGMALDPAKYFIIVPNMLGNGLSTSPSNCPPPYNQARFPNVTFYDQVQQQHRLVTEKFGIETLPLVTGWSMGAGQTYQWSVLPGHGPAGVPVLRLVEDLGAQHRLPRGRQGGADRG
jgi:homoserine O-acetyltransferase